MPTNNKLVRQASLFDLPDHRGLCELALKELQISLQARENIQSVVTACLIVTMTEKYGMNNIRN